MARPEIAIPAKAGIGMTTKRNDGCYRPATVSPSIRTVGASVP